MFYVKMIFTVKFTVNNNYCKCCRYSNILYTYVLHIFTYYITVRYIDVLLYIFNEHALAFMLLMF